jgi:hypothetical protein
MWQSLSFGANYKAAYCMAVCPAGDGVIGPFLKDRKRFLEGVVQPLQKKSETVYVVPDSDAEDHVARRFPNKRAKRVSNGLAGQGSAAGVRPVLSALMRSDAAGVIRVGTDLLFKDRPPRSCTHN